MEPSDTATSDFTAAAVVEEDVSLFLEGLGRLFVTNSIYPESHPRCRDVAESVFEEVQGLTRGGIEVTLTVEEESFQLQSQNDRDRDRARGAISPDVVLADPRADRIRPGNERRRRQSPLGAVTGRRPQQPAWELVGRRMVRENCPQPSAPVNGTTAPRPWGAKKTHR